MGKKCEKGFKKVGDKCVKQTECTPSSWSFNMGTGSGVGFTSLLTILFIGLKLGSVIDWSWWWVLSPLWISAGVGLLLGLIFFLFLGAYYRD